ncbi:hypothetical protein C7H19_19345 [Aphanothece hegewaldii CCALA 016]|uniref:Uncharacterized protein n=1 Tax=Aphanothece hegewaldii CCALA 016 TaxID=2107694 RepID=A0A2T1LTC9_9CHRO|nr:hypothetical protein [Aphanothece hegewaldii]PSF33880.1 hypothetical protein C7H19_19345 [Aphanothece hegewaldii CCALA 016]
MKDKNFIKLGEKIISLNEIKKLEKDKDCTVKLYVNNQKGNSDFFEFKGEKAQKVWELFSNMSIDLPIPEETDHSWMGKV